MVVDVCMFVIVTVATTSSAALTTAAFAGLASESKQTTIAARQYRLNMLQDKLRWKREIEGTAGVQTGKNTKKRRNNAGIYTIIELSSSCDISLFTYRSEEFAKSCEVLRYTTAQLIKMSSCTGRGSSHSRWIICWPGTESSRRGTTELFLRSVQHNRMKPQEREWLQLRRMMHIRQLASQLVRLVQV